MRTKLLVALCLLFAATSLCFSQEETDLKGGADHPLFTRMPGYYIAEYEAKEFDRFDSYMAGAEAAWEGRVTRISYYAKTGAKQSSMLQIARNYENAVKSIGGKVAYGDGRVVEGKIEKPGILTYVHAEAFNEGRNYSLVVVEKGAMRQDVAADAASLKAGLASAGKVVVEGIYFEADKAIMKSESAPALEQIVKLLKQDPKLNLFVVGHTANVGSVEAGLKLSADRAKAIVDALVSKGIAAARLKAVGVGPYCPAASNRTEEGRAKNRRVELAEM